MLSRVLSSCGPRLDSLLSLTSRTMWEDIGTGKNSAVEMLDTCQVGKSHDVNGSNCASTVKVAEKIRSRFFFHLDKWKEEEEEEEKDDDDDDEEEEEKEKKEEY